MFTPAHVDANVFYLNDVRKLESWGYSVTKVA